MEKEITLLQVADLFLGFNDRSFQAHQQHPYQADKDDLLAALLVADLNTDRQLDLILQYYRRRQLGILYGFGNGSFQRYTPVPTVKLSQ